MLNISNKIYFMLVTCIAMVVLNSSVYAEGAIAGDYYADLGVGLGSHGKSINVPVGVGPNSVFSNDVGELQKELGGRYSKKPNRVLRFVSPDPKGEVKDYESIAVNDKVFKRRNDDKKREDEIKKNAKERDLMSQESKRLKEKQRKIEKILKRNPGLYEAENRKKERDEVRGVDGKEEGGCGNLIGDRKSIERAEKVDKRIDPKKQDPRVSVDTTGMISTIGKTKNGDEEEKDEKKKKKIPGEGGEKSKEGEGKKDGEKSKKLDETFSKTLTQFKKLAEDGNKEGRVLLDAKSFTKIEWDEVLPVVASLLENNLLSHFSLKLYYKDSGKKLKYFELSGGFLSALKENTSLTWFCTYSCPRKSKEEICLLLYGKKLSELYLRSYMAGRSRVLFHLLKKLPCLEVLEVGTEEPGMLLDELGRRGITLKKLGILGGVLKSPDDINNLVVYLEKNRCLEVLSISVSSDPTKLFCTLCSSDIMDLFYERMSSVLRGNVYLRKLKKRFRELNGDEKEKKEKKRRRKKIDEGWGLESGMVDFGSLQIPEPQLIWNRRNLDGTVDLDSLQLPARQEERQEEWQEESQILVSVVEVPLTEGQDCDEWQQADIGFDSMIRLMAEKEARDEEERIKSFKLGLFDLISINDFMHKKFPDLDEEALQIIKSEIIYMCEKDVCRFPEFCEKYKELLKENMIIDFVFKLSKVEEIDPFSDSSIGRRVRNVEEERGEGLCIEEARKKILKVRRFFRVPCFDGVTYAAIEAMDFNVPHCYGGRDRSTEERCLRYMAKKLFYLSCGTQMEKTERFEKCLPFLICYCSQFNCNFYCNHAEESLKKRYPETIECENSSELLLKFLLECFPESGLNKKSLEDNNRESRRKVLMFFMRIVKLNMPMLCKTNGDCNRILRVTINLFLRSQLSIIFGYLDRGSNFNFFSFDSFDSFDEFGNILGSSGSFEGFRGFRKFDCGDISRLLKDAKKLSGELDKSEKVEDQEEEIKEALDEIIEVGGILNVCLKPLLEKAIHPNDQSGPEGGCWK